MNEVEKIVSLFQLPPEAILNRTIPKSFFTREFKLTPDEKRLLAKPRLVENMSWEARLRLNTVNVPAYQSDTERFLEVQIFSVKINHEKHNIYYSKVESLFFKYIPYPLILISVGPTHFHTSYAIHHINQNHPQQLVIDQIFQIELPKKNLPLEWASQILPLKALAATHLKNLYLNYLRIFIALEVGTTLDKKVKPHPYEQMAKAYSLLQKVKDCASEIKTLKKSIRKSRQINEKVEMGNRMHGLSTQREKTLNELQEF